MLFSHLSDLAYKQAPDSPSCLALPQGRRVRGHPPAGGTPTGRYQGRHAGAGGALQGLCL